MLDLSFWASLPAQLGDTKFNPSIRRLLLTIEELNDEVAKIKGADLESLELNDFRLETVIDMLITEKHKLLQVSVKFVSDKLQAAGKAIETKDLSVTAKRCDHLRAICLSLEQRVEKDIGACDPQEAEMLSSLGSEVRQVLDKLTHFA
jgi:hypothetical protein